MIEQYLSNKNKNITVAKSEIFSKLNKAQNDKLYASLLPLSLDMMFTVHLVKH